jgi:hypothetical protein
LNAQELLFFSLVNFSFCEKVTLYGSSSRQQQDAAEMGVPGAASLLKAIRCWQLKQYLRQQSNNLFKVIN